MCKISVIIPAYNAGNTIENTLKSLIYQTITDFEAIIVNDGSTDNTVEKIQNVLKDVNFQWKLISQINQGVSAARNRGLIEAKGDYVCFLDADDYYAETFFEKMYNKAKENDADIVFCNYSDVNEKGRKLSIFKKQNEYITNSLTGEEALYLILSKKIWVHLGAVLYKRSLLIENHIFFINGSRLGEDTELNIKAFFHAKLVNSLCETLMFYVKRNRSATNREHDLSVFHSQASLRRSLAYLERTNPKNLKLINLVKEEILRKNLHDLFHLYRSSKIDNEMMEKILQNKVIKSNLNKLKKNELTTSEKFGLFLIKYCPLKLRTIIKYFSNLFYKIYKYKAYK
jgi:glycosyltransferase involved in cell wall biosynthesis